MTGDKRSDGEQGAGGGHVREPTPPVDEGNLGPDEATVAAAGRKATLRGPQAAEPVAVAAATLGRTGPFDGDGLLDGRYRLVKALGEGGMGAVYLVNDLLLRKHTALKTLIAHWVDTDEELERFWREAAIAHTVHHPNVARTYDIGEQDGVHYLTMEALQGETLMDRLRAGKLLDNKDVREIFVPLCRGLRAAHRAGIVHRDLKPANVMLVPDDRKAVVMDFGIAGTMDEDETWTTQPDASGDVSPWDVTSAGRGTPAYMAPEQWDERRGDHRTDIYALGVIMYVSITGKAPYGAHTMEELAEKHRTAAPPDVTDLAKGVDKDIAQLIKRCLAKSPDDRPADMDEVLAVLTAGERRRRYFWTLALSSLAVTAGAFAAYLAIFSVTGNALIQEVRPATSRLARLVAHDVSVRDLEGLDSAEDMAKPAFKRVLATLQRFKAEDDQIKYVYTMRTTEKPGIYRIVVDADPEETDDNHDGIIQKQEQGAPPGTVYDGRDFPQMQATLQTGQPQAEAEFAVDAWGVSLSGYAPVHDDTAKRYFVGVDMGNKQLMRLRIRLRLILSMLGALAILGYAVFWWPLGRGGTLASRLMRRRITGEAPE